MFLLRRNQPLAFQGYYDGFQRGSQIPVRQPWGMWGTSPAAYLDGTTGRMVVPSASAGQTGGVSHEFQPFTGCYGMEYELRWPIGGFGDQFLALFIMPNWSIVGPNFTNSMAIRLFHQPVGSGDTVRIQQWSSLSSFSKDVATASSPIALDGSVPIYVKVHVEDDRFVAVWVDDTITVAGLLDNAFQTGPRRRGFNFMSSGTAAPEFYWTDIYDRRPSCPPSERFSPIFSDDFNRANGAVGNGWTQFGSNAAIVSNSWSTTGTTDGNRAIIRPTGITTGLQRISAIVGGNLGPSADANSSLLLRVNSTGTQAIAANIFQNKLYISRLSGSLTNPTMSDFQALTSGVSIASGDKVSLHTWGDWAWVSVNDVRRQYAVNISAVVPQTNEYAGLLVSRRPFADSHSWNSVEISNGLAY